MGYDIRKYLKWLLIVILLVIMVSLFLNHMYHDANGFAEGDCVIIDIGNQRFAGQIYTVQGGGRYTINYINNHGDIRRSTIKHFQIEPCHNEIESEQKEDVIDEIEEQL